jgi:predicted dehydrogenase
VTIAVVGLGSIGLRHFRNLIAMGEDVVGVEPDVDRRIAAQQFGVVCESVAYIGRQPDSIVIATPATSHAAIASTYLLHGTDVFIEKPLCLTADEAHGIKAPAGRVVGVGYNLRFDPKLRSLKQRIACGAFTPSWARVDFGYRLSEWRPGDYRTSVSARQSSGGGILREASHELDLVRWLFGEWVSVTSVVRRISDLDIDVEDTVSAIIETVEGTVVELHLDMTRPMYRRRIEAQDRYGHITEWNLDLSQVVETYRDEMWDFIQACHLRRQPEASLEDGVAAMELDAAIRLSYETRQTITRDEGEGLPMQMWSAA